ncbi:MAG: nucleotidyltransferase family protein [Gemmatimonadota bacterium]
MRRDEALRILREHRARLEGMGVRSLALFGSVARDEAGPESDVDLLVELDAPTFSGYMDAKFYLEDLLGRKVDLVTLDGLRPRVRPYVEKDLIHVA